MNNHNNHDNILDKSQLEMKPSFERNLRAQLVAKQTELIKSRRRKKLPLFIASFSGLATASALALFIVLGLQNSQTPLNPDGAQPVLAQEVFTNAGRTTQGPLASLESIDSAANNTEQGIFFQQDTYRDIGPAYEQCSPGTEPEYNVLASRLMYYVQPPKLEVFFEKTFGPKATEPVMYLDTDTTFERLAKVIGDDGSLVESYLELGTLVDSNNQPLGEEAVAMYTDETESAYQLYITNVSKGVCVEAEGEEIVALTIRESDLRILGTAIYIGRVSDETLYEATRFEIVSEKTGEFAQFESTFIAEGFDEDRARAAIADNGAVTDVIEIELNDTASIRFDYGLLDPTFDSATLREDGEFGYSLIPADRTDLLVRMENGLRDYTKDPGGHGAPIGVIGFEEEIGTDDEVRYVDVIYDRLRELDPDIDTASRYIDDVVRSIEPITTESGLEAIRVVAPGAFNGEADKVYTIINTGVKEYPALVIVEDAEQHGLFKTDWQAFIDSVRVISN